MSKATSTPASTPRGLVADDPQLASSELSQSARIISQLREVRLSTNNHADLMRNFGGYLANTTGCVGLWAASGFHEDDIQCVWGGQEMPAELTDLLRRIMHVSAASRGIKQYDLPGINGRVAITFPTSHDHADGDLLCGVFPSTISKAVPLEWILTTIAAEIDHWENQEQVRVSASHTKSLADFLNFSAELNKAQTRLDATVLIVNEMRKLTGAGHVGLLLRQGIGGGYRVAALSDVETFDQQSETATAVKSAALVATQLKETMVWPSGEADESAEFEAVAKQYCREFTCRGCLAVPLYFSGDRLIGSVILGLDGEQIANQGYVNYVKRLVGLVGGHLEIVLQARRSLVHISVDQINQVARKSWARVAGAAVMLLLLAMLIPLPYKVGCDCRIQLVNRRFVASPFDATLEKTLVANGDIVQQGQVLAQLDGRQLRIQLLGLQSDLQAEQKKRDSALARGDVAQSQIAAAEMKRLDAEIALLQDRLSNLDIRSPIDGVVVSDDLDKVTGVPLEMGQQLFEIGPLEELVVDIQVPEPEIQYISAGMPVRLKLESLPFQTLTGTVARISPQAEIVDDRNVFMAEVVINNPARSLRPGMKGRAKIIAAPRALGWNLFHRAWDRLRIWMIW